jgi:hypothetical protein
MIVWANEGLEYGLRHQLSQSLIPSLESTNNPPTPINLQSPPSLLPTPPCHALFFAFISHKFINPTPIQQHLYHPREPSIHPSGHPRTQQMHIQHLRKHPSKRRLPLLSLSPSHRQSGIYPKHRPKRWLSDIPRSLGRVRLAGNWRFSHIRRVLVSLGGRFRRKGGCGRVEEDDEGVAVVWGTGELMKAGGEERGFFVGGGFIAAGEEGIEEGGSVGYQDEIRERGARGFGMLWWSPLTWWFCLSRCSFFWRRWWWRLW